MIRKIKKVIKKIVFKFIKPEYIYTSYSQAGEDRILSFLFNSLGIYRPTYIDVGSNRPDVCNNTYLFYLRGSKGICIDPDVRLIKSFVKVRPSDVYLNIAVGYNEIKKLDLFVFDEPSVNTLSPKDAQERIDGGEFKLINTIPVNVKRLEEIIKENNNRLPHFISLDIEGLDYEVLKAFNFEQFPIPIWVVETIDYSPLAKKNKNYSIIDLMLSKNYFVYADTYLNTIFVLKEWFDNYNSENAN